MSNLKINTTNNHYVAHHQNSNKNFKSDAAVTRKYTNEELLQLASYGPNKKLNSVAKNALNTILFGVPLLDTGLRMATKKGSLSSKYKAGLITSALWSSAFAIAASIGKIKRTVNDSSKFLYDFNKEHRVASMIIDLGAMYGILYAAFNGVNKTGKYIKQAFPKKVDTVRNKVVNPVKSLLDRSVINKKLVLPFENYLEKNPAFAKSFKITAALTVPTVMLATFLRLVNEAKKRNENVENNYYILKAMNNNYSRSVDSKEEV